MAATAPLAGLRILEMAGIGPGPFCGMMLADHGAEVIRVERPSGGNGITDSARDPLLRSRRTIALDLKKPAAIAAVRRIAATCDGLIEGYRPGVMERLGLGPDVLIGDNPKLVFGRMTGWGQTGPLANEPGHDIDYIAISGTLHALGAVGRQAQCADQSGGRFRRRRDDAGVRHARRDPAGAGDRHGPGRRLRDDRRIGGADAR